MRKRTSGRLQLHRETLRILGRNALVRAGGANGCTEVECFREEDCSVVHPCDLPPTACLNSCSCSVQPCN